MKKDRMPGYVALVLDKETAKLLRKAQKHPHVFCDHVMMAYQPDQETYNRYKHLIGKHMTFDVISKNENEKASAFRVVGVPSENDKPHITVSVAPGVSRAYVKDMLEDPSSTEWILPITIRGKGTVQYVLHKSFHNKGQA